MQQRLSVYIGERSERVGTLVYDPARPSVSQFCYADSWVSQPNGFAVSPELPLLSQWIFLNDAERNSPFPFAFADTEPDSWGRRLIKRSFSKAGHSRGLSEIDFLKDGDTYKYIASTRYGFRGIWEKSPGYYYGNIMYRARNAEDAGVFITENVCIRFNVRDNNEFMFERCKNQIMGNSTRCIYYENVKDLVEWDKDERENNKIWIKAGAFLVDDMECPLKYCIQNAFDGNPATSYVENIEKDMVKILFYPGYEPDKLAIINGYAQNNSLYKSNNRIKTITDNSGLSTFELKDDCLDYQYVPWRKSYFVSTDIYKGEQYNNTCIAELNFLCNNSWLFGELNE